MFVTLSDIQDIVVVDGKIPEDGIGSQSVLFHCLNGSGGKTVVGGGIARRDVPRGLFVSFGIKWHVNVLESISADDGIDHAAPHEDSEFLFLDIVPIPALYTIDGVSTDHCVFPVFHHDRTLDTVSEGAVQDLNVGVVFIG